MGAITNLLTAVQEVSGNAGLNTAAAAQAQTQDSQNETDSVRLSEAQQAYQLYNQGLPITQIASSLSLSVAAVDNYLNISSSSS